MSSFRPVDIKGAMKCGLWPVALLAAAAAAPLPPFALDSVVQAARKAAQVLH